MNLPEVIRKQLEKEYREGHLVPGQAIDEKALALRFKTSRTPVREALLLLSANGLIDIQPRAGIFVRKLKASELVAMMEALGELEAVLARLATQRIDAQKREELMASLQQTQQAADNNAVAAYIEANARLHEVIYRASGNPYLVSQTKLVRLKISGYRRQLFAAPGRLIQSQQEHRLVVDAILAGHANAAYDLMRVHISAGGQAFADLILTNEF